ncbi:hypothetical protein O0L34_g11990 [Tuta absoluta]|nr:hypothetical protein O0L34_g11990 [Tuta absoluta]
MSKRKRNDSIKQEVVDEQMSEKVKMRVEREKHYNNIRQVLAFSNATAIRTQSDGFYLCCFCNDMFPEPADLKEHNLQQHFGEDIKNATFLRRTHLNNLHVKLDITGLECNLCNEGFENIEPLMEHLKVIHDKVIHTDINHRLVPFKFQPDVQLTCFMCSNVFNKFKALLEHMNSHYRNFVCGVCDAGYVNKATYCAHYLRHLTGAFKCRFCPQVFDVRGKKHTHERTVHTHGEKKKINRCGICDETFEYFFQKERHRREVHNVGGEVKCQACDRIFRYAKDLRIHVRRDHLMDKRFKCAHCDMKFFTNTLLNDHMAKHTRVKAFKCDMCHKAYTRRNTLVAHKKKAHKNIDVVDDDAATETESD